MPRVLGGVGEVVLQKAWPSTTLTMVMAMRAGCPDGGTKASRSPAKTQVVAGGGGRGGKGGVLGRWRYGKGTNPCSASAYGFDAQIGLFARRIDALSADFA